MQQIKTNTRFILLVTVLFLISCNETETTSEKIDRDTTQFATIQDESMPEYDPAMDSYNIGGDAIKKLGDTLGIKMYEFTAKPGETFCTAFTSRPYRLCSSGWYSRTIY